MGTQTAKGWNILDRDRAVLWREYKFGQGLATTFVFRGAGDGLIVVSPGTKTDDSVLDELSDFGKVVALVASNGYHWLGQPQWRKRFPGARSFAPAQGIDRLAAKCPELGRFEPLEALAPLLGDRATVIEGPGLRVGNAFATVRTPSGTYWYPSDFLSNIPKVSGFVMSTLMKMTDSAPGFRLFRPSVWLQVKDKPAFGSWMGDQLAGVAPTTIVPAHGAPVDGAEVIASAKAQIARL